MAQYLALVLIGAGSSFGRSTRSAEEAVALCKKSVEQDWSSLYDLDGQTCKINLFEMADDVDQVWWDHRGVHIEGTDEILQRKELVEVTLKVKKRRR